MRVRFAGFKKGNNGRGDPPASNTAASIAAVRDDITLRCGRDERMALAFISRGARCAVPRRSTQEQTERHKVVKIFVSWSAGQLVTCFCHKSGWVPRVSHVFGP